jgi:hypothetical protein
LFSSRYGDCKTCLKNEGIFLNPGLKKSQQWKISMKKPELKGYRMLQLN